MNNKGFTMIELLATMILLSILMLTAVPTVLRTMENNRKKTVLTDAKKFVANVEYKLKNNNNYIRKPKSASDCIIVTLGYLDLGTDFKEGPHGGAYDLDKSYVVVKLIGKNPQRYNYYVTLVETYGSNAHYGVRLLPYYKVKADGSTSSIIDRNGSKAFVDGIPNSKLSLPNRNAQSAKKESIGCGSGSFRNEHGGANDRVYDSDDALNELNSLDE